MIKVTKTLKELNVEMGDVVSYAGKDEYIVAEGNKLIHPDGKTHHYDGWDTVDYFSIVSRATQEPKLWKDMSPEEKGALLLAHYDGETIEVWVVDHDWSGWVKGSFNLWAEGNAYRVKRSALEAKTLVSWGTLNHWHPHTREGGGPAEYRITFNMVYGKPNLDSIKMEKI